MATVKRGSSAWRTSAILVTATRSSRQDLFSYTTAFVRYTSDCRTPSGGTKRAYDMTGIRHDVEGSNSARCFAKSFAALCQEVEVARRVVIVAEQDEAVRGTDHGSNNASSCARTKKDLLS